MLSTSAAPTEKVTDRTESARIALRTSPQAKALIERAAALTGATVSSFISQTMYEVSSRILAQAEIITLSNRDRDLFLNALENPPEPTQALIDLMRAHG